MYLAAPVSYLMLRKFPRWRKRSSIIGFFILTASLIGASFANTVPELLITQGVLYGIGGSVNYFPVFTYLDEWFVARKSFAYGVVWAGGGTAGAVIPLIMEWILHRWGYRTALRTWVVISTVLTIPALFFMKGRLPVQHASTGPRKTELGFLKGSTAFWVLTTGNILQSLGYYMPSLYLPCRSNTCAPFDRGIRRSSSTKLISSI